MMKKSSNKTDFQCNKLIEVNVATKIRKRIVSIFTIIFIMASLISIFFAIKDKLVNM